MNGAGEEAGNKSASLLHSVADIVAGRGWKLRLRGVCAVLSPWPNDYGAVLTALEHDRSVIADPGREVLLAVLGQGVEPDKRVRAEAGVAPVPCVQRLVQGLDSPLLVMIAKSREAKGISANSKVNDRVGVRDSVVPVDVRDYLLRCPGDVEGAWITGR